MSHLSITPPQIELIIKPNSSYTQAFSVKNLSQKPIQLTSSIKQWLPSGPNGEISFLDSIDPHFSFSLNNANLLLGQSFELQPGQKQQLVLKISTIQSSTQTSDGYFSLIFEQIDYSTSSVSEIGANIIISLSDSLAIPQANTKIDNIMIFPTLKDSFLGRISIIPYLKNLSSRYFLAEGEIVITKNNLIISKIPLLPQNILANSTRILNCSSNISCQLSPPLWPGKYNVSVNLVNESSYVSNQYSFFVFPFSLVGVLFIMFIFHLILSKHFITKPLTPKSKKT